ncbi:MAG: nucleotidyltransferase [Sedimentisphaerales bacterium]|nr:nucleotidyltransferase [Sedimentisphaerales bacterium]
MVEQILKRIAKVLDDCNVPYMVIGGQAALIYGLVRNTRDIDITLGVGTEKTADMLSICEKLGLKVLSESPLKFAQDTLVLPVEDPRARIRIDFMFSFSPYEKTALKRAEPAKTGDYPVRFASREDLIIHKIVAGRAVDMEDVKGILIKCGKSFDVKYIRHWLDEFAKMPECENLTGRFEELLKNVGHK